MTNLLDLIASAADENTPRAFKKEKEGQEWAFTKGAIFALNDPAILRAWFGEKIAALSQEQIQVLVATELEGAYRLLTGQLGEK